MRYTVDEYGFLSGIIASDSFGVTDLEPPAPNGVMKPRWDASLGWSLVRDFRGQMWFNSETMKYDVSIHPYDDRCHPWVPVAPGRINNDEPHDEGDVFNYATKQWVKDAASLDSSYRLRRANELSASDWTQLPDVPLATKEAWATYRQALRDITAQPGYPFNIIWPQAPQ